METPSTSPYIQVLKLEGGTVKQNKNRKEIRSTQGKFIQFTPVNEGSYSWPSRASHTLIGCHAAVKNTLWKSCQDCTHDAFDKQPRPPPDCQMRTRRPRML
ncbi:hypothetical protein YC2023_121824 [Brassica napus]